MTDRTAVLVKFPADLLALIDEEAAMRKISRTAVILDRCERRAPEPAAALRPTISRPPASGVVVVQRGAHRTTVALDFGPAPSPPGSRLKQPRKGK